MNGYRIVPLDYDAYQREAAAFEHKYGLPSDRLVEAFTVDGELVECDDFDRWLWVSQILRDRDRAR